MEASLCKIKITPIIVCSKNESKNKAVETVIKKYFKSYKIIPLETDSGVSETPMNDDEGIAGCINRIKIALQQNRNGNLYVAMEGILSNNKFGTFLCGWTVIYNKNEDEYYYGCSAKVKIPDDIVAKTSNFTRLSTVVAQKIGSTDEEISKLGTNGLISNGAYTRTDEFIDSVTCAISTKFEIEKNIHS